MASFFSPAISLGGGTGPSSSQKKKKRQYAGGGGGGKDSKYLLRRQPSSTSGWSNMTAQPDTTSSQEMKSTQVYSAWCLEYFYLGTSCM